MPTASPRPAALVRRVVFVDGVRTPFGRARKDGLYAHTRADDLSVKTVRELLRRHPELPPERIDEVAIAATTQQGDQGLTLGRTVGVLAGLPRSVPGYAIDRMCAGAMTAVTNTAAAIGFGAQDVALAGGVEHMGHHPMGFDADPNPRFLSERLVANDALNMGVTAENLHDKFPALTRERADAYGVASQDKYAAALAAGKIDPDLVPVALRDPENGWGLATADEPPRPGTTVEAIQKLPTPFRAGGRVTAGTAAPADRRRRVLPARRRGDRRRAGPAHAHAHGLLRVRRRRARDHGHRPGPGHRQGARPRRPVHRGHRPVRDQRGVRRPGARRSSTRSASPTTTPASTSTAARSPSATRWPRRACA